MEVHVNGIRSLEGRPATEGTAGSQRLVYHLTEHTTDKWPHTLIDVVRYSDFAKYTLSVQQRPTVFLP